jgi:hypothetical protein
LKVSFLLVECDDSVVSLFSFLTVIAASVYFSCKYKDGFHVFELLKTTKDIITDLQDKVLNDVLPTHQKSIIQFYLRQIQSFNDVMADLGLFGLMQDILEMYKVVPRTKKGAISKSAIKNHVPNQVQSPEKEVDEGPEIVELDPNKSYNFRTEFSDGYIDPFSGTAPGPEINKEKNDPQNGSGGKEDFVIYFDMKTGVIGKIPRKDCMSKSLIVSQNDQGDEVMCGEILDDDEREKLVWDMKRAMKNKKGDRTASKSPGANRKKYVIAPRKDATERNIGRSTSNEYLKKMTVPSFDKENNDIPPLPKIDAVKERRHSSTSNRPTAAHQPKRLSLPHKELQKSQPTSTSRRPSIQKVVKDSKPSDDGWSNPTSMATGRRSK